MAAASDLPIIRENTYHEWWRIAQEAFPSQIEQLGEQGMRFMRLAYLDGFNNGAHFASTNDGAQWLRP